MKKNHTQKEKKKKKIYLKNKIIKKIQKLVKKREKSLTCKNLITYIKYLNYIP